MIEAEITPPLTVAELLDFEAAHPGIHPGAKETTIRATFGISSIRYHQLLNQALMTREALQHDPFTTNRLLRLREDHRARRIARNDLIRSHT